jgi:Zn-finger nucleic acid-binding protein
MQEVNYEGVATERCGKCGGAWLDEGELAAIVNTEEEKFPPELVREVIAEAFAGLPPAVVAGAKTVLCPKCTKAMRLLNYSYDSGVIIDRCPSGHGVWVDAGELEKIQAYHEEWQREAPKHRDAWMKLVRDLKENPDLSRAKENAKRADHRTILFRKFFSAFGKAK